MSESNELEEVMEMFSEDEYKKSLQSFNDAILLFKKNADSEALEVLRKLKRLIGTDKFIKYSWLNENIKKELYHHLIPAMRKEMEHNDKE